MCEKKASRRALGTQRNPTLRARVRVHRPAIPHPYARVEPVSKPRPRKAERTGFFAILRARYGLPVGFCSEPRCSRNRSSHLQGRARLPLALRWLRVAACSGRARASRALARFARAFALPSGLRGPVEAPPWYLQRVLPGRGAHWHGSPRRFFAPQTGVPGFFRLMGPPAA